MEKSFEFFVKILYFILSWKTVKPRYDMIIENKAS